MNIAREAQVKPNVASTVTQASPAIDGVINSMFIDVSESQVKENKFIASLDPLKVDATLLKVPDLNKERNTNGLIRMLRNMLPSQEKARSFDYYHAAAAMRDIGILLGSIKRHHIEPTEVVPGLSPVLQILGKKTNLPPRDTLIHYTLWNPEGDRHRLYTDKRDEVEMIKSVRDCYTEIIPAIIGLTHLHEVPITSPEFIPLCQQIIAHFKPAVNGIVHTRKSVSPEFFANELRFYYDPIKIDGKDYIGAGAVELPMFVFDHLLWSSDCHEEAYVSFKQSLLPFIMPFVRDVYQKFENKPSLLTKIAEEIKKQEPGDERVVQSYKTLMKLVTLLKSFRIPHKKVADEAYDHTEEARQEKNYRTKGSGGYSTKVLSYILNLTLERILMLQASYEQYTAMVNTTSDIEAN